MSSVSWLLLSLLLVVSVYNIYTCRYGKSGILRVDRRTIGTTESAGILTSLDTSGNVFIGQLFDHSRARSELWDFSGTLGDGRPQWNPGAKP